MKQNIWFFYEFINFKANQQVTLKNPKFKFKFQMLNYTDHAQLVYSLSNENDKDDRPLGYEPRFSWFISQRANNVG